MLCISEKLSSLSFHLFPAVCFLHCGACCMLRDMCAYPFSKQSFCRVPCMTCCAIFGDVLVSDVFETSCHVLGGTVPSATCNAPCEVYACHVFVLRFALNMGLEARSYVVAVDFTFVV